jgi:hypothetical protein
MAAGLTIVLARVARISRGTRETRFPATGAEMMKQEERSRVLL